MAFVGGALTLALAYVALAWTMLLLGLWCFEDGECGNNAGFVATGVVTGVVAAIGVASAAWAVLLGARLALSGRPASGVGRAIGIALGCLACCFVLGLIVVST